LTFYLIYDTTNCQIIPSGPVSFEIGNLSVGRDAQIVQEVQTMWRELRECPEFCVEQAVKTAGICEELPIFAALLTDLVRPHLRVHVGRFSLEVDATGYLEDGRESPKDRMWILVGGNLHECPAEFVWAAPHCEDADGPMVIRSDGLCHLIQDCLAADKIDPSLPIDAVIVLSFGMDPGIEVIKPGAEDIRSIVEKAASSTPRVTTG